jgi:flagellar motor switch protein FliM
VGDILSQDEIDALLASVGASVGGGPSSPSSSSSSSPVSIPSSQQEKPKEERKVSLYDFRRPDRVSKDQMRVLQNLHEGFSRVLSTTLTSYLRTLVEVELVSVDQLTYSEFVMSVTNPSCIYVFQMEPLSGSAIFELNPTLVFFMIDRLFGGPGKAMQYNRELTDIERSVMNKIVERLLMDLKEAWEYLGIFHPKIESYENNPQFVQIAPASETVILISFELRSRHTSGLMSMCLPYMFLEPVMSNLTAENWISSSKANPVESRKVVEREMASTPIEVKATVGKVVVKLSQMLRLQEGDVIVLEKPADSDLVLKVGGKPTFLCRQGQVRNRKCVQITGVIEREVGDVD